MPRIARSKSLSDEALALVGAPSACKRSRPASRGATWTSHSASCFTIEMPCATFSRCASKSALGSRPGVTPRIKSDLSERARPKGVPRSSPLAWTDSAREDAPAI